MTIGGNTCGNVKPFPGLSDQLFTCELPAGVGENKLVRIRLHPVID